MEELSTMDNIDGVDIGHAASSFLRDLDRVLRRTEVTDRKGDRLSYEAGCVLAVSAFRQSSLACGKVGFIGNGGSAAISSHLAIDMWKNGHIEALAFNDAALLTCISNDCGYENVFAEPLRRFMRPGDTVVAISSSGRSANILNGVAAAHEVGCTVVTLSGFEADNLLRLQGDVNFHVQSSYYGLVEAAHLAILHSMLDAHMGYPVKGRRRSRVAVSGLTDGRLV
jgi:D-sedoheptulose 7-phosphate isomerase